MNRELHNLTEQCKMRMDTHLQEAAVRTVNSAVPGLRWEVEKDNDKGGGFRIRLLHSKSNKLIWSSISDVVDEAELASSLKVLDRIWGDTSVKWDVPADDLTKTPNLGTVVSGVSRRIDAAKRKVRPASDVGSGLLGNVVKFQERLQSALRKGEVREDDTEN